MSMSLPNPQVDFYFRKSQKWPQELETLRALLLGCGLSEELKWGVPCYTSQHRNVVLLHQFKEYCAVLFPKGVLLADPHKLLVQQTANSQTARQLRFTSVGEITALAPVLQAYVAEATEKAGLRVDFKPSTEFTIPAEFQEKLDETPALKTAFQALTPGRQRAYLLHFAAPKQAQTRQARVEKCVQRIFDGQGLND